MKTLKELAGKKISLSEKEISRSEKGEIGEYTIISRPQANGTTLIAAVKLDTREIIPWAAEIVNPRKKPSESNPKDISTAVSKVCSILDRMSSGGEMASRGRDRKHEKGEQK